jgi:hypothetical protein
MRNLSFVIWMILFPVSCALSEYLYSLSSYSTATVLSDHGAIVHGITMLASAIGWAVIGFLLYEPPIEE